MAIIYLIRNRGTQQGYVGRCSRAGTNDPERLLDTRWNGHVGGAIREDNRMYIDRAITLHGPDAFERSVVEVCDDAVMGERETYWIKELYTHVSEGGYNLTSGGDGGLPGHKHTDASKELMRQKAFTRPSPSVETRAKMRAAKSGKRRPWPTIARRVTQVALNGTVVASYSSFTEASRVTGMSGSSISRAVKSGEPTQGYTWHSPMKETR